MSVDPSVTQIHPSSPIRETIGGNGGNGLVIHRLNDLERRMGTLERKVDDLSTVCTRIETKLNDVANKSYVLHLFGVTIAILMVTLVGHAVVRLLVGPSG